jgi:hypothetical protein
MVSDLVRRGFSHTAMAAAVHMGVPPSAVHTHRVEEQRNGEGGCGPVVCPEGGVAGAVLAFEQRVDVGVPEEVPTGTSGIPSYIGLHGHDISYELNGRRAKKRARKARKNYVHACRFQQKLRYSKFLKEEIVH